MMEKRVEEITITVRGLEYLKKQVYDKMILDRRY